MPPTLITRDAEEIRRSARSTATSSSSRSTATAAPACSAHAGDQNLASLLEIFSTAFREPHVVQRYLPGGAQGRQAIILIDGEPVGAINRVPAEGRDRAPTCMSAAAGSDRDSRAGARHLRAIGRSSAPRLLFVGST
jgi:glutathione synthase